MGSRSFLLVVTCLPLMAGLGCDGMGAKKQFRLRCEGDFKTSKPLSAKVKKFWSPDFGGQKEESGKGSYIHHLVVYGAKDRESLREIMTHVLQVDEVAMLQEGRELVLIDGGQEFKVPYTFE